MDGRMKHLCTLPCARIVHLCAVGDRLWALGENDRKWWQLWKPATVWIDATPYIEKAA